jgi:GNAT superfamily N-acetyltransferase
VTVQVRREAATGAEATSDRDFVQALGRGTVMSSVGSLRHATEPAARAAFERLCDIVAGQSHVTFIAHEKAERVGFLLLLDELPDEVTLIDQGFIAYMAVEPKWQGTARRLYEHAGYRTERRLLCKPL